MRIKKKILLIANYPIKEPRHGGQIRVRAMVEEYRKVFTEVRFVAVFVREHYPIYDVSDIYLTGQWANMVRHDHLTSDIQIGHAMNESRDTKRKLIKLLQDYQPDIIEIEQSFPYIGLKPILEELQMSPKVVFILKILRAQ